MKLTFILIFILFGERRTFKSFHKQEKLLSEVYFYSKFAGTIFSSSTTAQPILTPRSLMKELDDVGKRSMLNSLLQLKEVTLEHCEKNEIVKHHSQEVGLQRQVLVDFFCDPDHLRNQVGELTARVRALQAS